MKPLVEEFKGVSKYKVTISLTEVRSKIPINATEKDISIWRSRYPQFQTYDVTQTLRGRAKYPSQTIKLLTASKEQQGVILCEN